MPFWPPRRQRLRSLHGRASLELLFWWLETVARHRARPSSLGKYQDLVEWIVRSLGGVRVQDLRVEQVASWQSELLSSLSPKTVADTWATLRAVMEEAQNLGLAATGNPVDRVKPPTVRQKARRALTAGEAAAQLVAAAPEDPLGAAKTLLLAQGWRVSEALGLSHGRTWTWTAPWRRLSRACVYADGHGIMLGPPKTKGAEGRHLLAPTVVELLRRRKRAQADEVAEAGARWWCQTFEGRPIELVFTTPLGGFVLRQAVTKAVANAARAVGLDPTGLGTHGGRSTAITVLYAEEGIDLADVALYVGHGARRRLRPTYAISGNAASHGRRRGTAPRSHCACEGRKPRR